MRKRKLLSLLVLLMTAATGAWAQRLYLEVNGTAATLKYSANEADYSDKPYFNGTSWQNASGFKASVKTITVDASCENFAGDKLDGLFSGCSELTSITGLGTINTTNVTTMRNMFQQCSGLTTLTFGSSFNTAKVTDMSNMFYYCSGLGTLDLSSFNTSSVTTMSNMFYNCSGLGTLDLSSFNTSSVTDMSYMFRYCAGLQTLDISSFNTGNVTKMGSMFYGCSQLTAIFVGADWSVASSATNMFTNCTNLPNWDETSNGTHANTDADGYLNKVKVTANEGASGEFWATYYNEYKHLIAPTGTQVFKVALSGTTLAMNEITDRIVNKGQGVVLKGTSNSIILDVNATASDDNYSGNSLQGTMTSINTTGANNYYVLNKKDAGVGFYKLKSDGTIGANKAYLTYSASAREFFGFEETETTSIEGVSVNEDENSEVYDLQGRRVVNPTKGLYIVNGKKVFINK